MSRSFIAPPKPSVYPTGSRAAQDAVSCAQRLGKPGARVQFILAGSVLLKQPRFAEKVSNHLRQLWPNAVVTPLERESVWGAVKLAKQQFQVSSPELKVSEAHAH